MAIKQNANDHMASHPRPTQTALDAFYVNDGLMGEDSIQKAKQLREELEELFDQGGFHLRKWKSSEQEMVDSIPLQMRDAQLKQEIAYDKEFTKVLGIDWNTVLDLFRPVISSLVVKKQLTKWALSSHIARLFDILGWCSPTIIKSNVLLQQLWESKLDWDEPVPTCIQQDWEKWHKELTQLRSHLVDVVISPRCKHD